MTIDGTGLLLCPLVVSVSSDLRRLQRAEKGTGSSLNGVPTNTHHVRGIGLHSIDWLI